MVRALKSNVCVLVAVLMTALTTSAQMQPQRETLSVQGYPGLASVFRARGRIFVDVEELARITNGSLTFDKNRMILSVPLSDRFPQGVDDARTAEFSPAFRKAAIEAMASTREWGGMLQVIVQNGYPVGKAMAGNTIRAYQGRAADSIALAAAAASTDPDYRGLELLQNEFSNMQAWANRFIDARNSLSAADLSTSENPLNNDADAQKIMACGQFLVQMFAGGAFQDDAACH
jgi:hypothetical protein